MKANNVEMNADTEYFFKNQPVEMQDCIHVCLIGDSSKDVYVRSTYHTVGRICIGPFIRYFRMPAKVGQVIHGINLGKRFKLSILDNELRS